MTGGWRIGTIGGVEVRVDASWSVIAVLVTITYWTAFSDSGRFPELTSGAAAGLAVATALLFFSSVLAHELAHAFVSKARRIPVKGITLFLFGGATHAEVDAKGPADEFLITAAGPATSLLLGALFLLGHSAGRSSLPRPVWLGVFGFMAEINFLLGLFNLLPGFPLDGGRLLRSGLWRATGSLERATLVAARVGQAIALAIIGLGFYLGLRDNNLLAGLWPAFIGWFLFRAAGATLGQTMQRQVLGAATAGDVMSSPPPAIPADMALGPAIDRYLRGHEGEAFPVMRDGQLVGFVSLRTAREVSPELPVAEAAVRTDTVAVASPEDRMDRVADRLGEQRARTVLVLEEGQLVGVIEPEDVSRFFQARAGPPGPRRRARRRRADHADRSGGLPPAPARPDQLPPA